MFICTTNEYVLNHRFDLGVFCHKTTDISSSTMTLPDSPTSTQPTAVLALMAKITSKMFFCFFFVFLETILCLFVAAVCPASVTFQTVLFYLNLVIGLQGGASDSRWAGTLPSWKTLLSARGGLAAPLGRSPNVPKISAIDSNLRCAFPSENDLIVLIASIFCLLMYTL